MQDIPPAPIWFLKDNKVPIEGIQHIIYADPNVTQEEPLVEDSKIDDVGDAKGFLAWWHVEIEGDAGEEVGHQVC